MALLNRISQAIETCDNLNELLTIFLEQTLTIIGANAGVILLRDAGGKHLRTRAAVGHLAPIYDLVVGIDEGISGWVFQRGEPYQTQSLNEDPLVLTRAASLIRDITSGLCLPMRSASETFGVFHISSFDRRIFTSDEIRFLTTVTNTASATIYRTLLIDEIRQQAEIERQRRQRYEDLVAQLPVGVALLDEEGRVLVWNEALARASGILSPTAQGCTLWKLMSLDEKAVNALKAGQLPFDGKSIDTPLSIESGVAGLRFILLELGNHESGPASPRIALVAV